MLAGAVVLLGSMAAAPVLAQQTPYVRALGNTRSLQARAKASFGLGNADKVSLRRARYVVMLGDVRTQGKRRDNLLTRVLRREVASALRSMRRVAVITEPELLDADAKRSIRKRELPVLRMEANLTDMTRETRSALVSTRCEVSLMLLSERDRAIRAVLRGAATGSEQPRRPRIRQFMRLTEKALTAAVRSALSDFRHVIARALSTS